MGLSSVFYGALEAAVKDCWENTLPFFISVLKKTPTLYAKIQLAK